MGARDLLADLAGAGLSVTAEGGRLVIRPASKLTDCMRDALRIAKPELLALLAGKSGAPGNPSLATAAVGACGNSLLAYTPADLAAVEWSDADMARFSDRRARLMRWGWAESEAERQAEKLVLRDREADPRVSCTECHHYRPGRCSNHRRAGLQGAEVGRDLAARLQRCPGFQDPRKREATT